MNQLLPFKKLYCENCDEISKDIWNFISTQTDTVTIEHEPWRFLNVRGILNNVPSLVNYFLSLNLKLRDVAAVVITDEKKLPPHKDEPPVIAKINFPVLNTENTWNVWWDDNNIEIGRVEMTQPIAFNASIKHGVEFNNNPKFPRIVLSCMFIKEPIHLLAS